MDHRTKGPGPEISVPEDLGWSGRHPVNQEAVFFLIASLVFARVAIFICRPCQRGGKCMTTTGWVFMITAWTAIISVLIICYYHILRTNKIGDDRHAGTTQRTDVDG